MIIGSSQEIRAGVDRVWELLIDWDNERKYWTNERDIRIIRSDGVTIEREATVGPRGFAQRTKQTIVLNPKKSIRLALRSDQIAGERTITLVPSVKGTRVDIAWDLNLSDVPGFVEGIVQKQIAKVTVDALKKMAKDAEAIS